MLYLRQWHAMVLGCKGKIGLQGSLGAFVASVLGLDCIQYFQDIVCCQYLLCKKLWQIVLLLLNRNAELRVLRVEPPPVQVRDIPHGTHCERRIETSQCVRVSG